MLRQSDGLCAVVRAPATILLMDDQRLKAFEFAQELTKQLLTLATAIFALTLTFVEDIAGPDPAIEWLYWAWALYIASVLFGIASLMLLAGNLERSHGGGPPSIYAGNTRAAAALQILSFTAALVLTLVFGAKVT